MKNRFLEGFKEGATVTGRKINFLVTTLILSLVFLIGLGPSAVIAKLFRKKFFETKISKDTSTYWSKLNLESEPIEEYYKQY